MPRSSPICFWQRFAGSSEGAVRGQSDNQWLLAEDAIAAKDRDGVGLSPLPVLGLLGEHSLGDEICPFGLPEMTYASV